MERLFEESVGRGWGLRGWPALRRFEAMKKAQEWAASPRIDVFEEENDVVVKAEVPGLERENIELSLEGDTLTIKGEKKKEEKLEDKDYFYLLWGLLQEG
jgi:HSP20 family protein